MSAFLRVVPVLLVILLASTIQLRSQDMPVRVEAIRLMERANDVSLAAHIMPNCKLEGTFRAYGLDGGIQNGTFNTIYSVDSERYETVFGNYRAISLHFPDRIVQEWVPSAPPETLELSSLTPLIRRRTVVRRTGPWSYRIRWACV